MSLDKTLTKTKTVIYLFSMLHTAMWGLSPYFLHFISIVLSRKLMKVNLAVTWSGFVLVCYYVQIIFY